ncbi:MAG: hypothetical protein KDH98_22955, partial [Calditrichaeota bacterium]|nr:hypothetical protein [Calditrichota bacterium]
TLSTENYQQKQDIPSEPFIWYRSAKWLDNETIVLASANFNSSTAKLNYKTLNLNSLRTKKLHEVSINPQIHLAVSNRYLIVAIDMHDFVMLIDLNGIEQPVMHKVTDQHITGLSFDDQSDYVYIINNDQSLARWKDSANPVPENVKRITYSQIADFQSIPQQSPFTRILQFQHSALRAVYSDRMGFEIELLNSNFENFKVIEFRGEFSHFRWSNDGEQIYKQIGNSIIKQRVWFPVNE